MCSAPNTQNLSRNKRSTAREIHRIRRWKYANCYRICIKSMQKDCSRCSPCRLAKLYCTITVGVGGKIPLQNEGVFFNVSQIEANYYFASLMAFSSVSRIFVMSLTSSPSFSPFRKSVGVALTPILLPSCWSKSTFFLIR